MREPTFEPDGNRWIWRVYGPPLLSGENSIRTASAISFPSREAAEENYQLHDNSRSDGNGRRLMTAIELGQLLSYAAEMSDGCSFNGYVVRAIPGADRCNWSIFWTNTDQRCKQLMSNAVAKIRHAYNLTS